MREKIAAGLLGLVLAVGIVIPGETAKIIQAAEMETEAFFGAEVFSDGSFAETENAEAFGDEAWEEAPTLFTDNQPLTEAELPLDAAETVLAVQEGEDLTEPLNRLLFAMGQRATEEKPCKVIIPPGNYCLTGCISTYSNIHLYAEGAVITKTSPGKHIMLRLGNAEQSAGGYEGYRNVIIEGGTWNGNYETVPDKEAEGGFVFFRIGHASDVTIKNVTFLNNLKSHFLELAGVRDTNVIGCTFRGYWDPYEAGGQECIQLDVCLDRIFPGYLPFDGAACENVRIEENIFENVFAGVGSHSMVFDRPYKNISISKNSFRNVKKYAVWCLNYRDSCVENNVMENVGAGVYVRAVYSPNTHLLPETTAGNTGNQYPLNVTVAGNRISLSAVRSIRGAAWKSQGIQVLGEKVTGKGTEVPVGIYRTKAVTVTGNTITGPGNGIRLFMAEDCQIKGNRIELTRPDGFSNFGIYLGASDQNTIYKNTVKNSYNAGIYLYNGGSAYNAGSSRNSVLYNKVTGARGNGILAEGSGRENAFHKNTVDRCSKSGIAFLSVFDSKATYNKITDCGRNGIRVEKSEGITVHKNTASGCRDTGIYLRGSDFDTVSYNTSENNRRYGIFGYRAVIRKARYNHMEGNTSAYGIYALECRGLSVLRKPVNKSITSKTRTLSGKAAGSRNIVVTIRRGSSEKMLASKRPDSSGKYRIPIKRQRRGTVLAVAAKDRSGNYVTASYKVR